MTIQEALLRTQGKGAGMMIRPSVRYAQSLLLAGEEISTALSANINTKGERFPGLVILTDQRIMAVCGLPGIRRSVILPLDTLEKCEEKPTAINYKAIFSNAEHGFSFTVDPDAGEAFSRNIAILNGQEDAFDAVNGIDSGILNPTLVRNRQRAKEKARMARAAKRDVSVTTEMPSPCQTENESAQEVAARLARQLDEARASGTVQDTDPKAVAARLAAELAAAESENVTT